MGTGTFPLGQGNPYGEFLKNFHVVVRGAEVVPLCTDHSLNQPYATRCGGPLKNRHFDEILLRQSLKILQIDQVRLQDGQVFEG